MKMESNIKNIIFDFGGVIMTIDYDNAVRQFENVGLEDARRWLDPCTQGGIFGELERGDINAEEFQTKLSEIIGRELSWEECRRGWMGYLKEIPKRNLEALKRLRQEGYRLIMLSNTNPFMMEWAESRDFDGEGHSVHDYFDAIYVSYKCHSLKPDKKFFKHVIEHENVKVEESLFLDDGPRNTVAAAELGLQTICPKNGEDWTDDLFNFLGIEK